MGGFRSTYAPRDDACPSLERQEYKMQESSAERVESKHNSSASLKTDWTAKDWPETVATCQCGFCCRSSCKQWKRTLRYWGAFQSHTSFEGRKQSICACDPIYARLAPIMHMYACAGIIGCVYLYFAGTKSYALQPPPIRRFLLPSSAHQLHNASFDCIQQTPSSTRSCDRRWHMFNGPLLLRGGGPVRENEEDRNRGPPASRWVLARKD